ncbi:hypothetical protein [Pontibacter litorisediminis]|uniref:hypothetical protein n=1 Tax=Pontibacter litorisediminis TaxID=1846260 RepID=UPI0023EB8DDE|nr:hypothetical protein [Pontibacter litorisediminis]
MKKTCFILLSCFLFTSCDKEDASPGITYPATYKSETIYNTTPVYMFTSVGEVKDQAVIHAFAKKRGERYFLENKEEPVSATQLLTLLSAGEAEVTNSDGTTDALDVQQEGKVLLFTSKEEGSVMVPASQVYLSDLLEGLSKYKPIRTEKQELAPATGYAYTYKTRSRFYGEFKDKGLHMHRMFITLKRPNGATVTVGTSNAFDPEGLNLLQTGDTLLVQSFMIASVKQ